MNRMKIKRSRSLTPGFLLSLFEMFLKPFFFKKQFFLLFLIILLACASTGKQSASGDELSAEVIRMANDQVQRQQIPPELRTDFFALYAEGRQNSVLHAMNGGLAALRLGYGALARQTWDRAIREVEEMQYGKAQAERSKSKFVGEREKWFKGEPYERSALYFYRGLLYLEDQDFGNAAACFKRAQVMDITAEDAPGFSGDWIAAEAALIWTSYLQNDQETADQAQQRMRKFHQFREGMTLPQKETNALVVIEVGRGPVKWGDGKFGELLRFREVPASIQAVRGDVRSQKIEAVFENLFFQASTRGGRKIDAVLNDKASFKEDTQNATLGLAGGAVVASQAEQSGIAAGVLGLAAIGTGIFSAVTQAEADVRTWGNLPHSVYLLFLTLPEAETTGEWMGVDGGGKEVLKKTFTVTRSSEKKVKILWIRENL